MYYSGIMTKQKAGERKRTVTVTVGPMTANLAAEINKRTRTSPGYRGANLTDLASVGLGLAIREWAGVWEVELPLGWSGNFD